MYNERIVCAFLYIITKYGYPPKAEDTEKHLEEMKALGFKSVELEGIREEHLGKVYENRHRFAAKIKELGLNVPYFCTVLPGLSSLDAAERERQLALFEKGCEVATLYGSLGVLDNAPLPPYQFPEDIPVVRHYGDEVLSAAFLPRDVTWEKVWDNIVGTYRDACDIAARHGLTYLMHPAEGLLASNTDAYLYFHDAVGRDNLRFTLDTANQFVVRDNLALSMTRLKDHVDYIHVSDNRGQKVEHLAVGDGRIRWDIFLETLDRVGYKGYLGLDIGGDESAVPDLDGAYKGAAEWLQKDYLGKAA
ncbi:sugar phosphate isomerase/epimerase family protein [Pseudokordiimonas caeni]|uniref:sugar phosphate isomerase/epimerase family protein n=1 Tax=Pseudokordiimonas caeni TaxID=2997908 RepID=UPI002810EE3F|nr:sugar phosphate isomerase/epimerase family protein [Pseudokordiimonas caeni]